MEWYHKGNVFREGKCLCGGEISNLFYVTPAEAVDMSGVTQSFVMSYILLVQMIQGKLFSDVESNFRCWQSSSFMRKKST